MVKLSESGPKTASQILLQWQQVWGKQVVVTVAAAIAVEGNDEAHDNLDKLMEITDLNEYMTCE